MTTFKENNVPILLLNLVNTLRLENRKSLSPILRKPVCRDLTEPLKPSEMRVLVVNREAKTCILGANDNHNAQVETDHKWLKKKPKETKTIASF